MICTGAVRLRNPAGGRSGIAYRSGYGVGGGLRDSLIAHNTIYGATSELLLIQPDAGHRRSVVQDNILVRRASAKLADVVPGSGTRFGRNCWSGGAPGAASGAGDVRATPRFVRAGGRKAADYRLADGSPCAGLGARL